MDYEIKAEMSESCAIMLYSAIIVLKNHNLSKYHVKIFKNK